jgi:murein DD-endopeptidase MepM/ murein hydrolase activator NlpD
MNDLSISTDQSASLSNLSSTTTNSDFILQEMESFQQILSSMLLSDLNLTTNQSSDSTSLQSPLLFLMEQLQSQQLSSQLQNSSVLDASSLSGSSINKQNNYYPVTGTLTQDFHPGHTGVDIAVDTGTQVHSTISGKVLFAGWNDQGYGNLVIVQNGDYKTYYAHLSSIPVAAGQTVQQGEVIGLSGSTGNSTGPHVHYEVRKDNTPIDPATFSPNGIE